MMPLILLKSWGVASLIFMILMAYELPENAAIMSYVPIAMMTYAQCILHRYFRKVLERTNYSIRAKSHLSYLTNAFTITYVLFFPTILTNDAAIFTVLSCLWFPQVVTNFRFQARDRHYKYSTRFLVSHSMLWVNLAFEARSGGVLFN